MRPTSDQNLLIVSHHYNHFVKSQVDELANYYDRVTVLVRYNRIATLSRYLPIDYLKPFSKDTRLNREGQPENVDVLPVPLFYLPTSFSRRRLGDRHYDKVQSLVEDNDVEFDLVHSHLTWTAGYAGARIASEYDVPHVLTVHENPELLSHHLDWGNEDLYDAWRSADALIRVSNADVDALGEYNDDVVVVPNGYEVGRFEPVPQADARRHLGMDPDVTLLFSLGDLIERKGFHHTISILPELSQRHDVRYVIGGHGPMKSDYLERASDLGVEDRVTLEGYVPNEDLKYWMSAADLFVFPSHHESFGVAQLEALACGTPVVAARNGGSETVLTSEDVGILVDDPTDQESFAAAVERGLDRDWSEEAIVDHADSFTIPAVCEDIVAIHRDLVADSTAAE